MLTRQEVAERLGVSVRWLEEHRADGPPFVKYSHRVVRYPESRLEQWMRARLVT
ncbi:helix-turn-helix transcriptional regulator [Nesterenkonia sp. CL21]|uniref:helix-turn-helix transcriptional regulator n=1 Tax=Nesterenkonia sp. CL21 TaxID=3064894 RepID=UPI0037C7A551